MLGHAHQCDDASALGVQAKVLGEALHSDHLDVWHDRQRAGTSSVGVEVSRRKALRTAREETEVTSGPM